MILVDKDGKDIEIEFIDLVVSTQ